MAEAQSQKTESRVRFEGGGAESPLTSWETWGSTVSSLSGVWATSSRQEFWHYLL